MEKFIKIKTEDSHLIYGTLNSVKSRKLIIFVHGLTGHQNEHIFYNATKFFNQKNFDVFRFDLYSDYDHTRKLIDTTIKIHIEDLNKIVSFFSNKYDRLYLIGHSLGGPIILYADLKNINGIVLWDSSINLKKDLLKHLELKYFKNIKKYLVLDWNIQFFLHENMVKEFSKIGDYRDVAVNIKNPIKIICAEKGTLKNHWRKAIKNFNQPKEFVSIKSADHCFNTERTEAVLFKETLKWLKKH